MSDGHRIPARGRGSTAAGWDSIRWQRLVGLGQWGVSVRQLSRTAVPGRCFRDGRAAGVAPLMAAAIGGEFVGRAVRRVIERNMWVETEHQND